MTHYYNLGLYTNAGAFYTVDNFGNLIYLDSHYSNFPFYIANMAEWHYGEMMHNKQ